MLTSPKLPILGTFVNPIQTAFQTYFGGRKRCLTASKAWLSVTFQYTGHGGHWHRAAVFIESAALLAYLASCLSRACRGEQLAGIVAQRAKPQPKGAGGSCGNGEVSHERHRPVRERDLINRETSIEASVCVGPVTAPARQKKGRIAIPSRRWVLFIAASPGVKALL